MKFKPLFLVTLVASAIASLSAFAADAAGPPKAVDRATPDATVDALAPQSSAAPVQELTPKILYQYLLAEIALGRGQVALSAAAYADLAKSTRDPRIARRAAEIAYYARQPQLSLEAARIWSESDPASPEAKQAYWALLANLGKSDQLATELARVVAAEPVVRRGPLLMQMGRLLSRFDDKKVVVRVVDQVTEPYLDLAEAHFVRAQAAYSADDNARASSELERALTLKPDWEPAAILKAQLLVEYPKASIYSLAAFIKKYPKAREARLAYARALIEGKHYNEARAEFAALLAQEPGRPDLVYSMGLLSLQSGDAPAAEKYLKSLLDKDFAEIDSVHFYLGQIAEEAGQPTQALAQYDAIVPGSQHYVEAQVRAAGMLAKSGQQAVALERLRAITTSDDKEKVGLLVMQAQLLSDTGKKEDAFNLLEDALKDSPDDAGLLYESALFAERLGKNDVLENNLRKVIKLKPDAAHAYNALGYSLADRNKNLDEANALIDKALALDPNDAAILDSKGWVNYRRGDFPAAVAMLQKALAVHTDPEISAHLGEVLWNMGKKDEARKAWNDALKAAPDNDALTAVIKRLDH